MTRLLLTPEQPSLAVDLLRFIFPNTGRKKKNCCSYLHVPKILASAQHDIPQQYRCIRYFHKRFSIFKISGCPHSMQRLLITVSEYLISLRSLCTRKIAPGSSTLLAVTCKICGQELSKRSGRKSNHFAPKINMHQNRSTGSSLQKCELELGEYGTCDPT